MVHNAAVHPTVLSLVHFTTRICFVDSTNIQTGNSLEIPLIF